MNQANQPRLLSGALGAEVCDAAGHDLRTLCERHGVLVVRPDNDSAEMTPDEFLRLASVFGEPFLHPLGMSLPGHPLVMPVAQHGNETIRTGSAWHLDAPYMENPARFTLLLGRNLPTHGGDTCFTSGEAAFAALSPKMQEMLSGLSVLHTSAKPDAATMRPNRDQTILSSEKRLVVDLSDGRKALALSPAHTTSISGMTERESRPLLEFLFGHMTQPEFGTRVSWTRGAIVVMDNRHVTHKAIHDYIGQPRLLWRANVR